ncbi:hypothetical protein GUITHDRAFT_121422 [Guillardia theta CCMP2712]|uniref:Uncharacterized protein n=1 Tax=Guillardia theta (strain CCMP2712) TaxID=905079 RepID=L1I868_GUITC|nr:hypothetical protein GUITHDRAFT_121422 [Guillardia theta CCMP2712]EKX32418.1 hypothetical protein GUITHDRAFT_121422 [Guillardia theta CCMP2712]|eukprot:XP_005819398.1 hypothetical protein GUITHDRAFT_121422 [Guillardia theta CCMP2712]
MPITDVLDTPAWFEHEIWPRTMYFQALSTCKKTRRLAEASIRCPGNRWELSVRLRPAVAGDASRWMRGMGVMSDAGSFSMTIDPSQVGEDEGFREALLRVCRYLEQPCVRGPTELVVRRSMGDPELWPMPLTGYWRLRRLDLEAMTAWDACVLNGILFESRWCLEGLRLVNVPDTGKSRVESMDVFLFEGLTRLRSLSFRSLELSQSTRGKLLYGLLRLTSLTELHITNNLSVPERKDDLRAVVQRNTGLTDLDLSKNCLQSLFWLRDVKSLRHLNVSKNPLYNLNRQVGTTCRSVFKDLVTLRMVKCLLSTRTLYKLVDLMACVNGDTVEVMDFAHNGALEQNDTTYWLSLMLGRSLTGFTRLGELGLDHVDMHFAVRVQSCVLSILEGFSMREQPGRVTVSFQGNGFDSDPRYIKDFFNAFPKNVMICI